MVTSIQEYTHAPFDSDKKQMVLSILKILTPVKIQHFANVQFVSNSKVYFGVRRTLSEPSKI